jgi:hypothetical protein
MASPLAHKKHNNKSAAVCGVQLNQELRMAYIKEIILKPISFIWIVVTGLASLGAVFIDFASISTPIKVLSVLSISLMSALISILINSYAIYCRTRAPATIRKVIEGTHHYQGTLVLIFDKSPWMETGQVVVLVQESDDVQIPIALVRIETTTTKGFPQGIILSPLSKEDLNKFLPDSGRWKSIVCLPDIKYNYLSGASNV